MRFQLIASDGAARRGRLDFPRGTVETPVFMPVGTYGTVKAMTPEELEACGAELIVANTFHLMLRPGADRVEAHGGLVFVDSEVGVGTTFSVFLPSKGVEEVAA